MLSEINTLHLYSDQLRQRLVRMSVRHHEQLVSHQQKEYQLTQSLSECAQALNQALQLLKMRDPNNIHNIPASILETAKKYAGIVHPADGSMVNVMTFDNNNNIIPYLNK